MNRPEPSVLWEALRGALAIAALALGAAVVVGGCCAW